MAAAPINKSDRKFLSFQEYHPLNKLWAFRGGLNPRGILLQDIAKKPNMLTDTAKSEICPVPLQNRVHLLKHTTPNILFIYQICGERR